MASFKHLRKEEEGGSSIHKVIDKVSSQGMEGKKADGDGGGASGGDDDRNDDHDDGDGDDDDDENRDDGVGDGGGSGGDGDGSCRGGEPKRGHAAIPCGQVLSHRILDHLQQLNTLSFRADAQLV